ncbi:MAG: hypothetical protein IGQ88_06700 [Gloeomargaritaceae cyanobacterium C42_A2020_066]|nr:hypothetical protein [Gloeomargaritaceae cyanobacterium C42_A2020_066]
MGLAPLNADTGYLFHSWMGVEHSLILEEKGAPPGRPAAPRSLTIT